jgi:hypothetical protein
MSAVGGVSGLIMLALSLAARDPGRAKTVGRGEERGPTQADSAGSCLSRWNDRVGYLAISTFWRVILPHASIAARSGLTPMMFMTRVRL